MVVPFSSNDYTWLKYRLELRLNKKILVCILSLSGLSCFAASSLGSIAGDLTTTGDILVKMMWAACIIVGVSLTVVSFTYFQTHRMNPKLVPLTTPILYLILGLLAICLPFAERIFGAEDSYTKEDQRIYQSNYDSDYDYDED